MDRAGLAAISAAALASTAVAGSTGSSALQAVDCGGTIKIPLITPLTGGGGPSARSSCRGRSTRAKTLGSKYRLNVQIVGGDTPVEKGPGEAIKVAQKFIADPQVAAVLGPATSGGVASASKALTKAGLAHISPSATDTSLAAGPEGEADRDPVVLPCRGRGLCPGPDGRAATWSRS